MKYIDALKLGTIIEKDARYELSSENLYGVSYAVFQKDRIVYKKCFGYSDGYGTKTLGSDTLFRIASMTKPITAFAFLKLIDKGFVKLSDPVKKYLPQFENIHVTAPDGTDLGVSKKDVTILHLFTHTSGIGSLKNVCLSSDDVSTVEKTIDFYVNKGLDFEPFTVQAYSPYAAFDVLVAIAEKVTGCSYDEFLEQEIFLPCKMKDTTFSPNEEQWNRLSVMHQKTGLKNNVFIMPANCIFENFPTSHKLGGAGLVSTLDDYLNFSTMLLNMGEFDGQTFVSKETFSLMCTPHVPQYIMNADFSWGLGVRVITSKEYEYLPVGSFGWSGAYGSHFFIDPVNKIAAVMMKNSKFDGGSGNKTAVRFEKAVFDSLI